MAEQTILVCDECGKPAAETVTIKVGTRNFVKDYCSMDLTHLTSGARAPRRGRRPGAIAATGQRRRGRPPKSAAAKRTTTGRRRGRPRKSTATRNAMPVRKSTGRRRGRPRKTAAVVAA